jgi:hypothetical protein
LFCECCASRQCFGCQVFRFFMGAGRSSGIRLVTKDSRDMSLMGGLGADGRESWASGSGLMGL